MGIRNCPDCGGQVSSSAKKCPHCGKLAPGKRPGLQLAGAAAIGILIAVWATDDSSDTTATSNRQAEPPTPEELAAREQRETISSAMYFCREMITRNLHDPDSADWTSHYEWPFYRRDDELTIFPSVRANNLFGGKVLQQFTCVVDTGGERMRLVSLE